MRLKLNGKEKKILKLKHVISDKNAYVKNLLKKYNECSKTLEQTQVNCGKWSESSKGFQMLLSK